MATTAIRDGDSYVLNGSKTYITNGPIADIVLVYAKTAPERKGKMISLATEADRTLFFDFLPLDLGTVRGFTTRFHLYTVPLLGS